MLLLDSLLLVEVHIYSGSFMSQGTVQVELEEAQFQDVSLTARFRTVPSIVEVLRNVFSNGVLKSFLRLSLSDTDNAGKRTAGDASV